MFKAAASSSAACRAARSISMLPAACRVIYAAPKAVKARTAAAAVWGMS